MGSKRQSTTDEKKEREEKKLEEYKQKIVKEFSTFQQDTSDSDPFIQKHKIPAIDHPDLSTEEKMILTEIIQKKDGAKVLQYLLYWGLPSSTTSVDHFTMTLLGLPINWIVVKKFKPDVSDVNGVSTFYTPFKANKLWIQKAEVLGELHHITKENIEILKRIITSREEVMIKHDQTKKENLVLSAIPASTSFF